MTVNKGLTSLVNASPNFSNQGLENAINELKIGWVTKSFTLDTDITDNTVLTTSQKNDVKDTINNIAHLNIGRYLKDLIRHTNIILDGSILPVVAGTENFPQGTFLEILQTVQSIQSLIPQLYRVPAGELNRDVNDHLGTLNNKFLETEDSSAPVFTSLKESITFINNASLATETALGTAYDNLKNFINSVVADSTDFQQTLNTFATAVATAHTNFNNALASEPYLTKKTQLTTNRDNIVTQQNLENSNVSGIRTYIETLSNNIGYTSLAEDTELRKLMARVSQNADWQTYFNDYETNSANLNTMYNVDTDSDKASVIDRVLKEQGLPDVLDYTDLDSVVDKAKKDTRIDTKNFDYYTTEQIIAKCCEQLGITTSNNTVYNQSKLLLNNLNQRDRDIIAEALDLNESSNTLS
jgi:hypothetical protein